jgi:ABC-2 type transport system ATP-binding protein
VKWRVVAGAVSLAFFFILSGVAEMIDNVLRVTGGTSSIRPGRSTRSGARCWGWSRPQALAPERRHGCRGDRAQAARWPVMAAPARPGDRAQAAAGGGRSDDGPAVVFEEVSKFYGEVLGVNRVTLNIPPGITSLVGPNGSGKTTLMNLMTGLIHPDSGRILDARDLAARSRSADADHRVRDAVRHGAALGDRVHLHHDRAAALRIRAHRKRRKAWKALERVGLTEAANRKVAAYSKGMRQRVRLAQAIAHDPELLVLDEPLNGLDPLVRAETIDLFRSWAAAGKHVILSSHVLQEVDVISDQVVLIANGTIVAEGQIRGVRDEIEEHPSQFIVRCRDGDASEVASRLFDEDHVTEIRLTTTGWACW